ncbi:MAG: response regulator, partial [Methanomassiliicoccales archaeon]|nr:response regulator [Methanomassiliicoccales archaeon]
MSPDKVRILALEDNTYDFELLRRELRKTGLQHELSWAQDKKEFVRLLEEAAPDLVLLDYSLPGFDGLEGMRLARERFPLVPVIIVSGAIGEEVATEAIKAGATDYVLKQRLNRLEQVVNRALREAEESAKRQRAEKELEETRGRLEAIVTQMPVGLMVIEAGSFSASNINEEAYRLLSLPKEGGNRALRESIGKIKILDQDGRTVSQQDRSIMLSLTEGAVARNTLAIIERPDGKTFHANVSTAPVRDGQGNIIAAVAMFTDVSEQVDMQRKIKSQADELARSNAELEQFAYVASHD